LSKSHAFDEVHLRIDLLINANTKVLLDRTLIFEHKIELQAINEGIDHCIRKGKVETVICVNNNDTIVANQQAGVTGGLVKALSNQAANKMLVPIMCSLFTMVQILLELNEISIICVFRAVKLAKLFHAWTIIPSLGYAHVNWIIESGLKKGLSVINLSRG